MKRKNTFFINKENKSFKIYGLRKVGKSSSGVAVITVLTSPTPSYTKDGVKTIQKFTCGKDCAYCPSEPEVSLNLQVIKTNNKIIRIELFEDISWTLEIQWILIRTYNEEIRSAKIWYDYNNDDIVNLYLK